MFKICCLDDFDYPNISQDAGATIYVDINDIAFPDKEWYDLPLSVLDMWCWNLIENLKPLTAEFSLHFMDGPYFIKCLKDNGNVKMQFIDNHKEDEQIFNEYIITFNELTNCVYEAACELVSILANHKIVDLPVLESLKKRLKKINKLIN